MANVELYIHPNWIPFYIECYNRMLFVEIIEGDVEEAKQILTDRYEDWVDGGPCEVCDVCCEEYMLEAVSYTHLDVYKRQEPALAGGDIGNIADPCGVWLVKGEAARKEIGRDGVRVS